MTYTLDEMERVLNLLVQLQVINQEDVWTAILLYARQTYYRVD